MIEAGIPCMSAGALACLARKAQGPKATALLTLVHPILMENLKIGPGRRLILKDKKYRWERRNGWTPHGKR